MKKVVLLSAFIMAAAIVSSCGNGGSEENMSLAVGSTSLNYKTDLAVYGLLGPVKTVKYEGNDYEYTFNPKGKMIDGSVEKTRFKGRVRTDETSYMTIINYTFDELGRVVSERASDYSTDYVYEGDAYYPSSVSNVFFEPGDEDPEPVKHVYEYKAKDFDEHGNWLVRKDNGVRQARTITYHEDPYDIGKQPHYKTPKDVISAMCKGRQKKDVRMYLSTMEYSMRVYLGETVKSYEENEERLNRDPFYLKRYKVAEERMKGDDKCDVVVYEIYDNDKQLKWVYQTHKGEDGYWYQSGSGYTEDD